MIDGVGKIVVPVEDQEQALLFWTGQVGFSVVKDESYGQGRWLEVAPADRSIILVLSPRSPDEPRREVAPRLPHSPVFFACADIEKTADGLMARGVRFPQPPVRMPFGWWAMFEDGDGTRYALGQW